MVNRLSVTLALFLVPYLGQAQQLPTVNTQPVQPIPQQTQQAQSPQTTQTVCIATTAAPQKPSWLQKHVRIGLPAIAQRALNTLGQQTGIVINPGTVPLGAGAKTQSGPPCPPVPASTPKP
jgi:hypothetical protein